jgi:general secretion pathway protein D
MISAFWKWLAQQVVFSKWPDGGSMKTWMPIAFLATVFVVTTPLFAASARDLFERGEQAEAREDYEGAYSFYVQASAEEPKEIRYRAALTRIRLNACMMHLARGRAFRGRGEITQAVAEFRAALMIDPSNAVATQELALTARDFTASGHEPEPSLNGPVRLKVDMATPISLTMSEKANVVFAALGKVAGINVIVDPDYSPRNISVDLKGVSLAEALEAVQMQAHAFCRPVTSNTIFVMADTLAKRKQLEQSAIRTFYLKNGSTTNDLQDSLNTLRQLLNVVQIQQVPSQNAIIVRGTPDQLSLAEKVLNDIDRPKAEVVVEILIMQVTRDHTRTLGLKPPQSASVQLVPNVSSSSTSSSSSSSSTSSSSTLDSITLNSLAHLNATDIEATVSAASISALLSDSNTTIIQHPEIRAVDNQKATLKIGERTPVATGSFSAGLSTTTTSALVNTQFQYIDVGVNVELTPIIHGSGDITLKLALEVSSVTGTTNIGGIDQPIIGQRKIEHEVRLKEGEVNLIGGLLEQQDVNSLSGIPGLSKVPLFKYLFSQTTNQKNDNEIVFALIPHVIRMPAAEENRPGAIDVGTSETIHLRGAASD